MANKNFQIAKFYAQLSEMKAALDNEIIPLGYSTGANRAEPKLFESLEILSTDIDEFMKTRRAAIDAETPPVS